MKTFAVKNIYKLLLNRIFNLFLALNIKPIKMNFKDEFRGLVIAPHPDDESIGCGGLLKLYSNKFDVICLTHGNPQDIRYREMQDAMKFAKINELKMLDIQDKKIISGQNEFNKLDLSYYDYIFIPFILDQHKDHKAVSILLNNYINDIKKIKPNVIICFYEVWSTLPMPSNYIDISSVIEEKKQMINFHKSQISSKNYADKIIGLNSYRGLLKNNNAAECFITLSIKDFKKVISKIF